MTDAALYQRAVRVLDSVDSPKQRRVALRYLVRLLQRMRGDAYRALFQKRYEKVTNDWEKKWGSGGAYDGRQV
ncbi:hypothetical protein [Oleidesulfovibrio sp.]|uniref:hypothetical protein n=1 Tax=Oleidesulfovibrio sp. TaxID=2909707 RepID=UPI003A880DF6